MWCDNEYCYYSSVGVDKEDKLYCTYNLIKSGEMSETFRCCEKYCPILHPELLKKKMYD